MINRFSLIVALVVSGLKPLWTADFPREEMYVPEIQSLHRHCENSSRITGVELSVHNMWSKFSHSK